MYNVSMLSLYIDISEEEITATLGAKANPTDKKTFVGWSVGNTDTKLSIKDRLTSLIQKVKGEGITHIGKSLPHEKSKHVNAVHIWLSAPQVLVQTKRVGMNQEKPFTVKPEYIVKMKKEAGDAFKSTTKGELYEQIEEQVSSITIDGYTTYEPLKKQAKHLAFTLYQAFAETNYVDLVKSAIHSVFGNTEIYFHARIHAFALAGFSLINPPEDFLVVDISEKTTSVIIIRKDGHVTGGHSLSGKEALVEEVSKTTKTTKEAALSLLELYASASLHEELTENMVKAFEKAKETWTQEFSILLSTLCQGQTIPHKVVFIKESLSPLFSKWIQGDAFSKAYMADESDILELTSNSFVESITFQEDLSLQESTKVKIAVEISSVDSTIN